MTKKELAMFNAWKNATKTTLAECYAKPSIYKESAYNDCRRRFFAHPTAAYFRIPFHNAHTFGVAWLFMNRDGDYCLHYETAYHTYEFFIG